MFPNLQKNRKFRASEYHNFFETTDASEWNFSKFSSFLIDTNDEDAKPIFAEKIWVANLSKLSRDSSVPQNIRKFSSETLAHHFAEHDCTIIQNALKSLEEFSSSKLILEPQISLARHVSEISEALCSTATTGKRDRIFASYMLSEEPFSKVQKVDHDAPYEHIDKLSSDPSGLSGLLNPDTSKNEQISKSQNLDVEQKENSYALYEHIDELSSDLSTSGGLSGLLNPDTFKNEQISMSQNLDVEQKENSYFQELSSVKASENLIMEKLLKSKSSIARYRIIFLPECNICDPIKHLYSDQEWTKMELDWEKVEGKITSSLSSFEKNMQSLLNTYSKSITDSSTGYYVDLNKVETIISQSPFADQHSYLFVRDWPLRWIQQLYSAFLTCLQTPLSPLSDADASEYSYRSRLINHLWEDVFFDVNCVIRMKTGEVENVDRRNQLGLARNPNERKSNAGSWYHDAILIMKVGDKDVQVAFGEVVGNAFKHDDTKMYEDREKILKAMQLALFNLRKLVPENEPGLEGLETFGLLVYKKEFFIYSMHLVDEIYLVDQFSGFTIPDAPLQLANLPDIVRVMIMFKHRVMKLQQQVESLYKSKKSFKRGGTRHANDSTIYASPQKKSLNNNT